MGLIALSAFAAAAHAADAGAEAEVALRARLAETFPEVREWQIEPLARRSAMDVSAAVEAEVLSVGARSAVRVRAEGLRSRVLWFRVAGRAPVATAARALAARERLNDALILAAERDVVSVPCEALRPGVSVTGQRSRIARAAGEVLCVEHLEPAPAVARGEVVTVRFVSPNVTVARRAIAQRDGDVGQSVLVRATDRGDAFRAEVSGAGEVVVHE